MKRLITGNKKQTRMASIYFMTQGCAANKADSEIMMGMLEQDGHIITEDLHKADLVIFNTCTVKSPTETHFRKKLKELHHLKKKIIIAGCILEAEHKDPLAKKFSCISPHNIFRIEEAVRATLKGKKINLLGKGPVKKLNLPKKRINKIIEIVPISEGCLGNCTYCKTKQARGNLISIPPEEIIRHIEKAVREGAKEIWLTSQDNGAYGKDINTNLVELLRKIVDIEGDFKIRIGMANPNFIIDFLDELTEIMKNQKVFKFIHIPLQSGNNQVLKEMNRFYFVQDFEDIVKKLRKEIPNVTILTDIICGFPTETEEQFNDTLRTIRKTRPDLINISRFWPRPGTKAAKLKPIIGAELKRRTREMTKLFFEIAKEQNGQYLDDEFTIIIDEEGKNNTSQGRNDSYRQVVVKQKLPLGSEVRVRIVGCTEFYLEGKIIKN
jgi:threonylcarbamoyladenosine tRNA methylthiotransferase CDKAL1